MAALIGSPTRRAVGREEPKVAASMQWQRPVLIVIGGLILITLANYLSIAKYISSHKNGNSNLTADNSNNNSNNNNNLPSSRILRKANSLTSYWWPSQDDGGLFAKIYNAQNPDREDCSLSTTKFFVWRSLAANEKDTRGITAWAHAGISHLLHALTDGDQFQQFGSRILITDDRLWPMAKGCENGPQTRECYFEPLTRCTLSDVDEIHSRNAYELSNHNDEYDRSIRTLFSARKLWFRNTGQKYQWTGLKGGDIDHSHIYMTAALLAYYLRPQPHLRDEIDKRLRRSLPADIDPDRTIGVPIRRSDKCHGHNLEGSAGGELDCPPLSIYLDEVKELVEFDPLIDSVIVTSEEKSACDEFILLMKKELPQLRVILNVGDVQQGTGSGSKLEAYVEAASNADVVASALTSMHMHLRARYFVITSKSTWTSTITVLARVYGFASDIYVKDVGRNRNMFSALARKGCEPAHGEQQKG